MIPFSTTPPTIEGSTAFGNLALPSEKEVWVYWTFLFAKRKVVAYNRSFWRGYDFGKIDFSEHRHKFRIKRMKKAERLFKHIPRGITITQL